MELAQVGRPLPKFRPCEAHKKSIMRAGGVQAFELSELSDNIQEQGHIDGVSDHEGEVKLFEIDAFR